MYCTECGKLCIETKGSMEDSSQYKYDPDTGKRNGQRPTITYECPEHKNHSWSKRHHTFVIYWNDIDPLL